MKHTLHPRVLFPALTLFLFSGCSDNSSRITPSKALVKLMQGNDRYTHDALIHPHREQERREAVISKQSPFAIIVGCSDSRVSPEIIFDQGVGDLFVVRVAGNVIGSLELDSIEYAASYLHSAIILVVGHENCGAVNAVIQHQTKDIESIAALIEPAVQQAEQSSPQNLLETAIQSNALRMKDLLIESPVLARLIKAGKLEVHAAYYHLQTGAIDLLSK